MLEAINHKDLQNLRAIIASDSSALVNTYSNFHYPSGTIHPISQLPTRLPYLKLVHINRRLNTQADSLAQQGKIRGKLLAGWPCSATNSTATVNIVESSLGIMQQLGINTHLNYSSEYLQEDNSHCVWISMEPSITSISLYAINICSEIYSLLRPPSYKLSALN